MSVSACDSLTEPRGSHLEGPRRAVPVRPPAEFRDLGGAAFQGRSTALALLDSVDVCPAAGDGAARGWDGCWRSGGNRMGDVSFGHGGIKVSMTNLNLAQDVRIMSSALR